MKRFILLSMALICILCRCESRSTREKVKHSFDNYANLIPVNAEDILIQNCRNYAERSGYQTGDLVESVVRGEELVQYVFRDDSLKKGYVDIFALLIGFENIHCVVDTDTRAILGRIPHV